MKIQLVILIFLITLPLFAQNDSTVAILEGDIKDERDIPISNAEITALNKNDFKIYKTNSNSKGYFKIELPSGKYLIRISYKDYAEFEKDFFIPEPGKVNELNIILSKKVFTTETIDVEGSYRQSQSDLRTSLFNFTPTNIKVLPGGLEDVLRSLKSLPGVSSPNDFTSQLIVRGSGPDQNLIIMDEVEIFNPYRLYGLVSMFNPETLSDINLITGGFPAKYGDRLSAVLDVTNREGTRDKYLSMIANINIASANVIIQGKNPLKVPGSWIISTRRTYYDLILGPFAKKSGLITDDSSFPSFQDVQFKVAIEPFQKNKFLINGIFSRDGVDIIPGAERTDPDSVNVQDVTTNNVLAVGWHYIPNPNFVSKTTFSWYRNGGDNDFEGDILDPLIDKENLTPEQRDSLKAIGALLGFSFRSKYSFRKFSLNNRSAFLVNKIKIEFGGGIDAIRNDITYTLDLDEQFKAFLKSLPNSQALLEDFEIEGEDNYRGSMYVLARFQSGQKFYYQPSFRLDYYSFLKTIYFSPRINFGYAINPLTTFRTSVGLYYQSPGYEKLVDSRTFYDLNGGTGNDLKAERAIHLILGLDRWLNNEWQVRFEGYYKKFNNLINQQKLTGYKYIYTLNDPLNQDPNYLKNPSNWTRSLTKIPFDSMTAIPVNDGSGFAYGIEFSLEKKYSGPDSKLYGWINYSYSNAKRSRDDAEYPFRFDQTHVINIVLNYRLNNWFEIGARWNYASNFPYTQPVGILPRVVNDSLVVNPLTGQVLFNLDYGNESNRFSSRKPEYHRLDVRFTAFTKFWNVDWSFYLDIINIYNRKNILGYDYSLSTNLDIKRKTIGMIPILPTLGINARF